MGIRTGSGRGGGGPAGRGGINAGGGSGAPKGRGQARKPFRPTENTFPEKKEFRLGHYRVIEEKDDYVICTGFDPNAKDPFSKITPDSPRTIKVAKPPLLQRTRWEAEPVTIDGVEYTYEYSNEEFGVRTARWTNESGDQQEEEQRIDLPYLVDDLLIAVEIRKSGAVDGMEVADEEGARLTWIDLNASGRHWKATQGMSKVMLQERLEQGIGNSASAVILENQNGTWVSTGTEITLHGDPGYKGLLFSGEFADAYFHDQSGNWYVGEGGHTFLVVRPSGDIAQGSEGAGVAVGYPDTGAIDNIRASIQDLRSGELAYAWWDYYDMEQRGHWDALHAPLGSGCGLTEENGEVSVDNTVIAGTGLDPEGDCAIGLDQPTQDALAQVPIHTAQIAALDAALAALTDIVEELVECCEDSRECCIASMQCCYETTEAIDYIAEFCCEGLENVPGVNDCSGKCVWQSTGSGFVNIVPCAGPDDCDCEEPAYNGEPAGDLAFTDCESGPGPENCGGECTWTWSGGQWNGDSDTCTGSDFDCTTTPPEESCGCHQDDMPAGVGEFEGQEVTTPCRCVEA